METYNFMDVDNHKAQWHIKAVSLLLEPSNLCVIKRLYAVEGGV